MPIMPTPSHINTIPVEHLNPAMPDPTLTHWSRPEYFGNLSRTVANSLGIASNKILFKLSDIRRLLKMLHLGTISDFPIRYHKTAPMAPTSVYRDDSGHTFGIQYKPDDTLRYTHLDPWRNAWADVNRDAVPAAYLAMWDKYVEQRIAHKRGDNIKWAIMPMDEVLYHLAWTIRENISNSNNAMFRHINSLKATDHRAERELLKRLIRPVTTLDNPSWQAVLSIYSGDMGNTTYRNNRPARRRFFKSLPAKYRFREDTLSGFLIDILNKWYQAKYHRFLPQWRLTFEMMSTDNYNFNPLESEIEFVQMRLSQLGQRHHHLFAGLTERNAFEDGTYRYDDGSFKAVMIPIRKSDITKGNYPKCECCNTRTIPNWHAWYHNAVFTDAIIAHSGRKTLRELLQIYTKQHAQHRELRTTDLVGPPPESMPDAAQVEPFIRGYSNLEAVNHDLNVSGSIQQTIAVLQRVQIVYPPNPVNNSAVHLEYLRRHGLPSRFAAGWMSQLTAFQRGYKPNTLVGMCVNCANELWFDRRENRDSSSPSARILETNSRHTIRNYTFNPMDVYPGFRIAPNERKILEVTKKWSSTGKSFTEKSIDRTPYFGIELEVTPGIEAYHLINKDRYPLNGRGDMGHIAQMIAAEITEKYLKDVGLGVLKMDGSVHGGFELVTVPATHQWHTEQGWKNFFKEDYPAQYQHLAPSYYLSGWNNNGITIRHPYLGRDYNTPTCGIHIHVSRDALSPMQFGKMQHFVNSPANKPFIELVAGRKENTYTAIIPKEVKAGAKFVHHFRGTGFQHRRGDRNEYRSDDMGGRYSAINVNTQGKPTIEFRIFRSNVAKAGFMKNIDFVHSLLTWCSVASADANKLTVPEYIKFIEQNRGQYKWMSAWLVDEQRIKRIHKLNAQFSPIKEFAA
jgi:hypothetical protein